MSYANVAANGSSPKPDQASETSHTSSTSPSVSNSDVVAVESEKPSDTTTQEEQAAPAPKKEKKSLAPAPVPTKSVWGASAASDSAAVDEHKWPTPDKAPVLSPVAQPANKAATKFIKPNKWVPINAKVVLPSPRSQNVGTGGQQKSKRKNKANRKKAAGSDSPSQDDSIKTEKKKDDEELDQEALKDVTGHDLEGAAQGYSQDRKRYSTGAAQASGQQGQKPNRKFSPQGVPVQNGKPPQQNRQQQNSYYNPYGNNQGYNNFNGQRQYRSGNPGQYRRNNSSGNIQNAYPNGYRGPMGMPFVPHIPHHPMPQGMIPGLPYGAPMPVQIPPPISPKQEPSQALTQQVDYYFSLENLLRDIFLRKNMGTEGWIDLDLILSFKRVKIITNGISNAFEVTDEEQRAELLDQTILAAVQRCKNVELGYLNGKDSNNATATEVQLRVKSNFEQWLLPDNVQL
ncbi:hypothetical protein CA3LBN_000475 [Candidozyma haemuli]|uniref:HTH La-type RNA-binding domain-containing protein n=1 Tax=Candidozyma haemuli TaxID=45357 RepID=A0ABX8I082_9ASCO|nr:hypothetical protein CA3LBN_000475 [[Candida] haemuloni]